MAVGMDMIGQAVKFIFDFTDQFFNDIFLGNHADNLIVLVLNQADVKFFLDTLICMLSGCVEPIPKTLEFSL